MSKPLPLFLGPNTSASGTRDLQTILLSNGFYLVYAVPFQHYCGRLALQFRPTSLSFFQATRLFQNRTQTNIFGTTLHPSSEIFFSMPASSFFGNIIHAALVVVMDRIPWRRVCRGCMQLLCMATCKL